jgi:aryl carrier-like protein
MCVGRRCPTLEVRIADDRAAPARRSRRAHFDSRPRSVTRGYFGDPEATARRRRRRLGGHRRSWASCTRALCTSPAAAKEIIFVNGQNYYPYDFENIAQRAPGLDLNKVVAAGVAKPGSQGEELVVFVLHRGSMAEFLPTAAAVSRLINEHTGLEVAQVIPPSAFPRPPAARCSGICWKSPISTASSTRSWPNSSAARGQGGGAQVSGRIWKRACRPFAKRAAGQANRRHDNLFEIGASSLKLIEIHENIDREFPGLIDLTELFDHPTIAELAKHLESSPPA